MKPRNYRRRAFGVVRIRLAAGFAALLLGIGIACPIRSGAGPTNDNFASATVIAGLTNFTTSNVGATIEPGELNHAGEPPNATLWWRWTAPYTGTFRIVTSNSFVSGQQQLDTVVAVYTTNSTGVLMEIVSNDDTAYGEFGALWSRLVFRAYAGERLYIVVGSLGATGTIRVDIGEGGPFMSTWTSVTPTGQPLYSSNYIGRTVMIDFWETTCAACVEELPDLRLLQDLYGGRGFTLLGLSGDPEASLVIDYLRQHPFNYPVGMGPATLQTVIAGGSVSFPTKMLLDSDGRLVGRYEGGNVLKYYRSLVDPLVRPNPQVLVRIVRFGSGIRLLWSAADIAYSLQESSSPTGAWSNVNIDRIQIGADLAVTIPSTNSAAFYRLIKP